MKKIFIFFLSMIVLSLSLVLPSFAVMTDSFGSYTNLFDPSDVVQARFYTDLDNYQENNFYSVNLEPNTDYTFISTSGSRSFFVGQNVIFENYSSTFSFDSKNLFVFNNGSFSDDGLNYTIENGVFTINGTVSSYAFIHLTWVDLEEGDYYLMGFTNDNSNNYNLFMYNNQDSSWYSYGIASGKSISSDRVNEFIIRFSPGTYTDFKVYPMLVKGDDYGEFMQGYMNPIYNDEITYIYNFRTPSSVSSNTQILVGINDVLSGSSSNKFSYNQSSENEFYLIEGSFTPDQIADVLQQDRYNQGFTQGYKEGEYDGMNSTSILKSVILTIFSGPFVIVSNALNFEIFGINLYTVIQILLTILVVAFLITRLKGRE